MRDDESEIRRTIGQYCHFCDDGRFDEWIDLFAEDATFSVLGTDQTGRDDIKAFIVGAQGDPSSRGKHVCFNTVIELDGDQARGWTDFIFVMRAGEKLAVSQVGRYHDAFVKHPDRWRFQSRRIVFMGDEPSP